jgi:hypothetical protein
VGIPSVGHLVYYLCIICHLFPFSTVVIWYWYVLFKVYQIASFSCSIEWDMLFGIIASFEVGFWNIGIYNFLLPLTIVMLRIV